jgi:hypothetical protein
MRELILITSHASNSKKEQMLRELVNDVIDKEYDIMISTHIFIPKDIFEKSNFVICDSENKILTDINQKSVMVFKDEGFMISSTETFKGNHAFAMIKLLLHGLSYAKSLGYEKVHFFEYDSRINNLLELQENSNLLESYNIIYYITQLFPLPSAPISFNLNKISNEWFELSDKKILDFFNGNTSKLSEEYEKSLIDKSQPVLCKDKEQLKKHNILVGLHDEIALNRWMVPIYHESSKKMFFFGWNSDSDKTFEVSLIINKKSLISIEIKPKIWIFRELESYDKIDNLTLIINNEISHYWDFNEIGYENFTRKNFIKFKNSE